MNSKLSDELIAHVASRMTDGEPSPRLRARVLAGLDRSPALRRVWWMPAVAITAGALAIVALWPRPQAPTLPVLPIVVELSTTSPTSTATFAEAVELSAPQAAVLRTRRANAAAETMSADELEFRARAIPALDTPAPLALEAIQPQPLSIPLLVISPLSSTATTAGGDSGK